VGGFSLKSNNEVTVLVPAYNEESRIKATILALQKLSAVKEIIVINDGSTDRTAQMVDETEAILLNLKLNHGKGDALNAGLNIAKGEIIALIDADLEESAKELQKLLVPVLKKRVDMTIAKFPPAKRKGGFGLVTNLAKLGLELFTGLEFESPLSGQRVLTREVIDYLGEFKSGFGVEVAMTIQVLRGGFEVEEIPVNMGHRETGRDWAGFKHRGRQFIDVLTVFFSQLRGER